MDRAGALAEAVLQRVADAAAEAAPIAPLLGRPGPQGALRLRHMPIARVMPPHWNGLDSILLSLPPLEISTRSRAASPMLLALVPIALLRTTSSDLSRPR